MLSYSVTPDSFATPWTVALQAPLSLGFSQQEYWSWLPFPSPGIFLTQETNLGLLHCRHILYWLHYEGKPNILNNSHLRSVVGSQETPGVTGKFGLGIWNEAGQRQIEFCQENALVIANTLFQQHKRRLYTWTSPDGKHLNQINYIFCSQRWRSSIQ